MSDEPRFGLLDNAQPYTPQQMAEIARAARPHVLGTKDAGKVYCPFCKLKEARWRRSIDPATPHLVDLFVYCTQCHKTGVTKIDLAVREESFPRGLFVLVVLWAVVVFLLRSPVVTSDGVQYVLDARAGEELWNPHHLLYTGALRGAFVVVSWLTEVEPLEIARGLSAGFFVLLLLGVGFAVIRRTEVRRLPWLAVFTVATVFGFLSFSTQPEPYVAAIAGATFAFAFANRSEGSITRGDAVVATLALALGTLFHQLAAFVGAALLVEALLHSRAAFRRASAICVTAATVVLCAYCVAWRLDVRGESFLQFLTRYSHVDRPGWGDVANLSVSGLASLGTSLRGIVCGIARSESSPILDYGSVLLLALVISMSLRAVLRAPRRSPVRAACLVLVVLYEVFCWWWIPELAKYQLFAAIPLLVLVRFALLDVFASARVVRVERVALLALALVNFVFVTISEHSARHLPRERAWALASAAGNGGVVVCDTETAQFVEYDHREVGFVPVALALFNAGNGTLANGMFTAYDPLPKARRIVVPLSELKPTYGGGGANGPTGARMWMPYLKWIFGVHEERPNETRRRMFEVIALANGEPAIALSQEFVATTGVNEIVAELDRELRDEFGDPPPFSFELHFERAGWR